MRRLLLSAWAIACLGFLALQSCYRPHFDSVLLASARFEQGLAKVARLGPVSASREMYEGGWFVPDRTDNPSFGWWAKAANNNVQLTYMDNSSLRISEGFWGMPMKDDSFILPLTAITASPISGASPPRGYLFVGGCAPAAAPTPYWGTAAVGLDASLTGSVHQNPSFVSVPTVDYIFLGGSIGPYMSAVPARDGLNLAFAWDDGSTFHLALGHSIIQNDIALPVYSLSTNTLMPINYPGPALEEGAFFAYYGDTARFYLSGYSKVDGSPFTCYFPNLFDPAVVLPGVDSKITALLSDGRLLARKGGVTKLYSAAGVLEASLNTGNMRYCYEIYSGGSYYSVFSRTYMIQDGNDYSRAKLYAEVFRVPTADLASLGN